MCSSQVCSGGRADAPWPPIAAIFCPFGQFCEIDISPLSLQKQPKTAPSLFQRGVEYAKYVPPSQIDGFFTPASVSSRN